MKLCTFVNIDDAIGRSLSLPNRVVEITFDSVENDFKDGKTATKPLPGQEISFSCDLSLLRVAKFVSVDNDL